MFCRDCNYRNLNDKDWPRMCLLYYFETGVMIEKIKDGLCGLCNDGVPIPDSPSNSTERGN